ncbi:hypothetical protein KAR91_64210 [Candidatus Pacearchaeota archaeon]|nr:hypothetical protein [Candidatus Pacearchaeota archaeon]
MNYLPPATNNYEKAQRVIIGYLLNFPSTAEDIMGFIRKSDAQIFTNSSLRIIFEAMLKLYEKGITISETAIHELLKRQGSQIASLARIFEECTQAFFVENELKALGEDVSDYIAGLRGEYYLKIIKEKIQRTTSFKDAILIAEEAISLDAGGGSDYQRPVEEIFDELVDVQTAIIEGRRRAGFSWGIPALDEAMIIRPGKLYTIAAQKGAGKTKLLLSVIEHNLKASPEPVPSLLFSLEMSDLEVMKYLASRKAQVDSSLILTKALPAEFFDDIKIASKEICEAPLQINSSPSLSAKEIVSQIRHWKIQNKVPDGTGIVGVDFLQLVSLDRQRGQITEATALKNVAYRLAEAAKEMKVSIITAAQLNKQADGAKPQIGFIEGSGGLAQASQGVILLDLLRLRKADRKPSRDGIDEMKIIVAKNRDGESMVTIPCKVDLSTGLFIDDAPAQRSLI